MFLSNSGSSSDDRGSESKGEQGAAGFITGLFKRDAMPRGNYERGWEEGQFECITLAGGKRKAGRRFKGCVALVQNGHVTAWFGRLQLGCDIGRLPSIVIDPRGTRGQALAAKAADGVQLATVMTLQKDSD